MIVTLEHGADADAVRQALAAHGVWVASVERAGATAHLVLAPWSAAVDASSLGTIPGVAAVAAAASGHPLVDAQGPGAVVRGHRIGPRGLALLCGPCAVESRDGILRAAERLAALGVTFLRGGAFKPRSSPYAFQGHGERALEWLRQAADAVGMAVVTEALSEAEVPLVAAYADLVQVGSRTMHDYALLKAIGRAGRPALLKRAMAATVDEWLLAGEYLLAHGAPAVVFCERGVRGFDASTRNLLDLGSVALLAQVHRVPVVVDPSHAAGRRDLVPALARAALAAGAHGLMLETHEDPSRALSDGPQALLPDALRDLLASLPGGSP